MVSQKGDTRQPFNDAVHNVQPEKEPIKPVPKMIRNDQPVPRPTPPSIGRAVDAQSFNQRWQQEIKTTKPLDLFDAIDAEKKALRQEFNQNATSIKKRGQELE